MKLTFKKIQAFLKRFDSKWNKMYRAEGETDFALANSAEDVKLKNGARYTELELWWRDDPEPFHVAVVIDEEKFIIYTKTYKKDKLANLKVLRDCSKEWQEFIPNAKSSDIA